MTVKELASLLRRAHAPNAEVQFVMELGELDFFLLPTGKTQYIPRKAPELLISLKPKPRSKQ
jgi:hypothetical protein